MANGSIFSRDSVDSTEPAAVATPPVATPPAVVGGRASGNLAASGVLDVVGEDGGGRESPETAAEVAPAPVNVATTDEATKVGGLPSEGNGNDAGGGAVAGLAGNDAGGAADDVAAAIARATADFARLPPRVVGSDKPAGGDKSADGSDKPAGGSDKQAGGSDKLAGGSDQQAGNGKRAGSNEKQAGSSDKQAGENGDKKGLAARTRSAGGGSSSSLMRGTASSSLRLKLTAPSTLEDNDRGDMSAPRTGRRASENAFHKALYHIPCCWSRPI